MKKALITLIVVVMVMAAAVYLVGPIVLDRVAQRAAPAALAQLQQRGLQVYDYDYATIRWSSPRTISVRDVYLRFGFAMADHQAYESNFLAETLNFRLTGLRHPGVIVSSDNISLCFE